MNHIHKWWKVLAAVVGIVAVLVASIGGVSAQQTEPGGGQGGGRGNRERGQFLAEIVIVVSEQTGLAPEEIITQLQEGATFAEIIIAAGGDVNAVIDAAVEAISLRIETAVATGGMTRETADQILANLEQIVTDVINGTLPERPEGRGGRMEAGVRIVVNAVAEATGLTAQEIMQQVADGATLADIITANGGDVDAVIAAAVATATEQINEQVAAGNMTQEDADELIASLETVFTQIVNGEIPMRERARTRIALHVLELAAEQTGLTVDEIIAQMRAGSSLADILTASGVDVNTFIDDVMAQAEDRVAQAVANGTMTQAEGDAVLARLREALETNIYEVPQPLPEATPSL
jgi:uncharacterized protein (DUF433 family)